MGKTACLFAGQGAQKAGMGQDLAQNNASAKQAFDWASMALGRDVSSLCFSGTQEELNRTENTQPCVLTVDMAAYWSLCQYGFQPDYLAGFSLGEYAALVAAKAMDFAETVQLVQKRARLMQESSPEGSGMAAVLGIPAQDVEKICQKARDVGGVWAVNYNCPGQTVIAGTDKGLDAAVELLSQTRSQVKRLAVSGAFHSPLMHHAAEKLELELRHMNFLETKIPVIANATANPYPQDGAIKMLTRQTMQPVLWEKTIRYLLEQGVDTFIECGPGKTLSNFMKRIQDTARVLRVEDQSTLQNTLEVLK